MRLQRLRNMTREELRWRASVALRTAAQGLTVAVRRPRWHRGALLSILTADAADAQVRAAVRARNWNAAHDALSNRLRTRATQFLLDPGAADRMRDAVIARWPDAATDAAGQASRIVRGEYDVLGYEALSFAREGTPIDWHFDPVHGRVAPRRFYARVPYLDPAVGDHKVIWEINRHQHWLRLGRAAWLSGERASGDVIIRELESWLDANPPLVGINWASMLEIGFRAIAWTWALGALLGLPRDGTTRPWLVDMLIALDRQLTHVERNLSYYFSPNTHLTGEALALYVVGTALPELAASARWAATGRRILLTEIDRQILPDGGHAERSTHYQRYTLDFYLLALLTARRAGDAEAESRFADAARRLSEFTLAMADDAGRLPLLGDDDGGMLWPLTGRACNDVRDSLSVAAILLDRLDLAPWGLTEEAVWILGPEAVTHPLAAVAELPARTITSRVLPDTGYVVMRDGHGSHAVLDAGAHGYMNGGHAHADALSLTLTLHDRPLLVDPGTSTYTMNPGLRDQLRSSASHNTVTVDGRSPSLPAGPFHWQTRTDARLDGARHGDAFDWVEASHDGYAPVRHRRSVVRAEAGGWLVADEILGGGRHAAAAHWHFPSGWTLARDEGRLRALHPDGGAAWLLHDGVLDALYCGDEESGLGWYAPVYGTLLPAWTARVSTHGETPLLLLTWIGDGAAWSSPSLSRMAVQGTSRDRAIAVQVTDGNRSAMFLVRPGVEADDRERVRVGNYETDARVLHHATVDGLRVIDLVDARSLTASAQGWISIDADEPVAALHVEMRDGIVDLHAAHPLATLRLEVATGFHIVRVNGREVARGAVGARTAPLVIPASHWHSHVETPSPPRPWTKAGAAFAEH